jgi:hypothetical protein
VIASQEHPVSVIRNDGGKVVLPRSGADEFWNLVHENFAGDDPRRWKALAILALRENAGWPLDRIGAVFGHPKGHVARVLQKVKADLRERFRMSPELLDFTECDEPCAGESGFSDPNASLTELLTPNSTAPQAKSSPARRRPRGRPRKVDSRTNPTRE